MPNYYTSLNTSGNPTDEASGIGNVSIDINDDADSFVIKDKSKFTQEPGISTIVYSDEEGHRKSDFSIYRKIKIIGQSTTKTYTSITTDADLLISAASSANEITISAHDGDGCYKIELCNIPTWREAVKYNDGLNYNLAARNHDIVTIQDSSGDYKFYKCIKTHISEATVTKPSYGSDQATYWEEVEEGTFEVKDNSSKYVDEEYILFHCALDGCIKTIADKIFCQKKVDFCDDNLLCKDAEYMQFIKLFAIRNAMTYVYINEDYEKVKEIVDFSKTLCAC